MGGEGSGEWGSPGRSYLAQVPRHSHIVPVVVVELAVHRFHQRFEGPGSQVDDQPHRSTLQGQVDVVGRLARVQHEAVALQRAERQRDLVRAALDGVVGQVVAEKLVALEGRHRFFFPCKERGGGVAGDRNTQEKSTPIKDLTCHPAHGTPAHKLACGLVERLNIFSLYT